MPIAKPWQRADLDEIQSIPAVLGVYELGDAGGAVIYVGFAGAREPFGMRSRLLHHFGDAETNRVISDSASQYRWESTQQYTSRHVELLMQHLRDHDDRLPAANDAESGGDVSRLGRLRRSR